MTNTMPPARRLLPLLALLALAPALAPADSGFVVPSRAEASRVNDNTVGVVFTHEELFHRLVHDLEDELEHGSDLRIVPIMGKNHVQSVYDLLYLKGIDLALVRADALEYVRREGDMGAVLRVTNNIAKVADEKIVIVSSTDYADIGELDGQAVGFGLPGSGEYVTGTVAFDSMGIAPTGIEVDEISALEKVRSGELAAMVYLLRAPDAVQTGADLQAREAVAELSADDGLHVLALPESDAMSAVYRPATLSHEELPLVPEGEEIPTYSVDVVIASYAWREPNERQRKQQRFVDAFVAGLDNLKSGPYQPVWERVDPSLASPNLVPSPMVAAALAEREASASLDAEAERQAEEEAAALALAERAAELRRRRDALSSRLDQELGEADSEELERMLERIDLLLSSDTQSGEDADTGSDGAAATDATTAAGDEAADSGNGTAEDAAAER